MVTSCQRCIFYSTQGSVVCQINFIQSRRPRDFFHLSYRNFINTNRSQYKYYPDRSNRAQGLIKPWYHHVFTKRYRIRLEITQQNNKKKMTNFYVLPQPWKTPPKLFSISMCLGITQVFWGHMTWPSPSTKKNTEIQWTLPQNPQNSINKFFSLGRREERGLNQKYFWSIKKLKHQML